MAWGCRPVSLGVSVSLRVQQKTTRKTAARKATSRALEAKLVQGQDIGQAYSFVYTLNAELGFVAYSQLATPRSPIAR